MVLTVAMAVTTITIPIMSVLSRFIIDEFGITRAQLGWAVAATPGLGALGTAYVGRLTDRVGPRPILLGLFLVGTGVVLGLALSPSFAVLLACTAVAGLLNATGTPSTNLAIATWLPLGRRGFVVGVKQSGLQMMMLLAGLSLPVLTAAFGWRLAAATAALVPLSGYVAAAWLLPRRGKPVAEQPSTRAQLPRSLYWLAAYAFTMGSATSAVLSFLPLFTQERLGFGVGRAGLMVSVMGIVAVGARLLWSWLGEAKDWYFSLLAGTAALGIAGSLSVRLAEGGPPGIVWVGAVLIAMSVISWNGIGMLVVINLAPSAAVGRASGLVHMGFLAGLASSPVAFGYLVDITASYELGWSVVVGMTCAALLLSLAWLPRREQRV